MPFPNDLTWVATIVLVAENRVSDILWAWRKLGLGPRALILLAALLDDVPPDQRERILAGALEDVAYGLQKGRSSKRTIHHLELLNAMYQVQTKPVTEAIAKGAGEVAA